MAQWNQLSICAAMLMSTSFDRGLAYRRHFLYVFLLCLGADLGDESELSRPLEGREVVAEEDLEVDVVVADMTRMEVVVADSEVEEEEEVEEETVTSVESLDTLLLSAEMEVVAAVVTDTEVVVIGQC